MEMYLVSYQKQGFSSVVYVATDDTLLATIGQALKESEGFPVLVAPAKTV